MKALTWMPAAAVLLLIAPNAGAQAMATAQRRDLSVDEIAQPRPEGVPRGYAVVIGISKYQLLPPGANLRFPESDATAIYNVLLSHEGGAFPAENIRILAGEQATLSAITEALEVWLPSKARPEDRVVVYFAGHGFVHSGRGYLAPWDVDPARLDETAYSMARLGRVMADQVKARWKVLLTDACHSAKITPESSNEALDAQMQQLPQTFLTFTAAREQEQSFEDPELGNGWGIFTYFLAQGLKGNADGASCDGFITADELIEYVRTHVRQYTRERGVRQTPTERGDFDPQMILGMSRRCTSAAPAQTEEGTLVFETNMDAVELYLDERPVGKVSSVEPLSLPGIAAGLHMIRAVRNGYEPFTKEVSVLPGERRTVTIRIQYRRQYKKAAVDLVQQGERLLYHKASAFNPLTTYVSQRQSEADIRKARDLFSRALREDPNHARAAYDLGMSCVLLSEEEAAMDAFQKALRIDPTVVEARVEYGGGLIERGDPDGAIRELSEALRLDSVNDVALSRLARAFLDKGEWKLAITHADTALARNPSSDQAWLWKGDALRHVAAETTDGAEKQRLFEASIDCFRRFLGLTNFSTSVVHGLAYYLIGFGIASRKHADRNAVFAAQRSIAYLGLCDSERALSRLRLARGHCEEGVRLDPGDANGYFLLANVYRDLYNRRDLSPDAAAKREHLLAARKNYKRMIEVNPEVDLARNARAYIEAIDVILARLN